MSPRKLSPLDLLMCLCAEPEPAADLVERVLLMRGVDIHPKTLKDRLQRAEAQGYVRCFRRGNKQRAYLWSITPAGEALADQLFEDFLAVQHAQAPSEAAD